MRVGCAPALCAAAAAFFVNPAAAQRAGGKLPPYVRLWNPGTTAPAPRWNFKPEWIQPQPAAPNPAPKLCGHIRVVPVDPGIDPKMILPMGKNSANTPKVTPAMPPCPEDIGTPVRRR